MRSLLLTAPLLLVAGCASAADDGPSLLPRAIEGQSLAEPTPAPPAPVAADPALDARIAVLTGEAERVEAAYTEADRTAAARLSAGARARVGSDAWLDAQVALAALEDERASLVATGSQLDSLAAERGLAGQPAYPALEAAQATVEAAVARVTARLDERKRALPTG